MRGDRPTAQFLTASTAVRQRMAMTPPLIAYAEQNFRQESLDIIDRANAICREYRAAGYDLTLRQVYYQFVSRGHLPNSDRSYKRLGSIINDARLAGLIDWNYITDRTRYLRSATYWGSPSDVINASAEQFQRNLWDETGQAMRPEVWVEKDALVGIVGRVCDELRVPYLSCRGYVSQSEMWEAGQRMGQHIDAGLDPIVIHLGDHDPSGLDMTRDIRDRLSLFAGTDIEVQRIALNMDQITQYNPPPNPAKLTDSRGEGYVEKYGSSSWELDALEPTVLADLIRAAVAPLIDRQAWDAGAGEDAQQRLHMQAVADRWDDVSTRWDDVETFLDAP